MSDPARSGSGSSSVRIPTGGEAGDAAQNVDANALQSDDDTYFNQDQYDPGSEGGERLIAHELAPVVQPGRPAAAGDATGDLRSAAGGMSVSSAGDAHEQAADRAAAAAVRQYPAGYGSFLHNAPPEMIPPWDRLSGLVDGTWNGSATDVRNAVLSLSPEQKARVRADHPKVTRILERSGSAAEKYRVVAYLDFKLERAIYWLSTQRVLPALTPHQWSQLLSEATRADHDELVGWAELWALVQTHCPASILQVTRQNSDPAAAATAFDDPVQIDTLFATLGPAGFLANATRAAAAVDTVYRKVQAKAKVLPTVEGLPAGAQMGAATQANLRAWFFTPASTDAECTKMFEQRFRVQTTGTGTYDHASNAAVSLQPFTKPGLSLLWTVCEALPPAHVETNPRLLNILRDQNNGPGNACYAGPGTGGQGDILMGYRGDPELDQSVYQAGGPGPGAPAVDMPMFTATLRHEIGHAVDSQPRGGTVARAPGT